MITIVDIGSNSIRAMEAECKSNAFGFSHKRVFTTRLAEGLLDSGCLSPPRIAQSLRVLEQIVKTAAEHEALPIFAYATSAVRDAQNASEFCLPAQRILCAPITVLSGEEEAAYAFLGATGGRGGLIDIGGGSAQVVTAGYRKSFPTGCVRAKDVAARAPALSPYAAIVPWLKETVALPGGLGRIFTGVGGTITTLGALHLALTKYDPARVTGSVLTLPALLSLSEELALMGDQKRRLHPILTERHDVICYGAAILRYLMEALQLDAITVSDADGMEGFARHILEK